MRNTYLQRTAVGLAFVMVGSIALAADFEITSYTIDGGGGYSAGGSFELEGTIGQPDVGYMSGGGFELESGFWPTTAIPACACLGDMNGDGLRNGSDILQFVDCLLDGGPCVCADVDGVEGLDEADTAAFVSSLLSQTACP